MAASHQTPLVEFENCLYETPETERESKMLGGILCPEELHPAIGLVDRSQLVPICQNRWFGKEKLGTELWRVLLHRTPREARKQSKQRNNDNVCCLEKNTSKGCKGASEGMVHAAGKGSALRSQDGKVLGYGRFDRQLRAIEHP